MWPYLPVNPECNANPCEPACTLIYTGPNLPCTGINNNDNISLALQKIDAEICIIKDVIFHLTSTTTTLLPNCSLSATVTEIAPSTTTTTTAVPTTTSTTTTVAPTTTTTSSSSTTTTTAVPTTSTTSTSSSSTSTTTSSSTSSTTTTSSSSTSSTTTTTTTSISPDCSALIGTAIEL